MNDTKYVLLEGKTTEVIVKLEPKMYRKYIWSSKMGSPCYKCNSGRYCTGCYRQP